jgi:Bacteriophage baseplate protein W
VSAPPNPAADVPGGPSPGFLGIGWGFPPQFGPGGAQVAMVWDEEDIHQSLAILFATRLGERPMQEDYGCSLDELLFEAMDHALVSRITSLIHDAVLAHEPRIRLLDVDVTPDPDLDAVLRIRLDYEVPSTNSRFNMVFPFYLNEATTPGG